MPSKLSDDYLHDEAKAYELVESVLWPDGPVCPHCGTMERASPMKGKSTRIGAYKCYACRKKFTVKIGTIFEDSHIPMRTWLQAIYLMASSKKGISCNQLHRTFGISLSSAWFMCHRIREAMRVWRAEPPPMGGGGGDRRGRRDDLRPRRNPSQGPRVKRVGKNGSPTRPTRTSSCRLSSAAARCAAITSTAAPSAR